ncbi:dihydroneopterin aldolase [Novosphingobium flavum]|uniref:Dihydroneopterin aldolase n=1 Tax=Novosphingobium flavum TaxID=1778672 RepID=A0A7X1FU29_9SPHN|nr:dihydroneopterin aldolase [Novosphingobium flavum]MBC2666991.1 dihydroneopterin aldolase [Novosphingobium flavum]
MSDETPLRIANRVRVRDLSLLADVGINPDEIGRRQPLVISVVLDLVAGRIETIDQTVDYRRIARAAEQLAEVHTPLIETFGQNLAAACLAMPGVVRAHVTIEKPFALMRGQASVEVTMEQS